MTGENKHECWSTCIVFVVAMLCLTYCSATGVILKAQGHDPTEPELDAYYDKLAQRGCCTRGDDCKPARHWEVSPEVFDVELPDGRRVRVPDAKVIKDIPNLSGRATLCWLPERAMLGVRVPEKLICFNPP